MVISFSHKNPHFDARSMPIMSASHPIRNVTLNSSSETEGESSVLILYVVHNARFLAFKIWNISTKSRRNRVCIFGH